MAGKAGGRLVFGGRQEYHIEVLADGYLPVCKCERGNHYLARDAQGNLGEGVVAWENIVPFRTYIEAQAAIEAWQRQHDAAQRASGETAQEG